MIIKLFEEYSDSNKYYTKIDKSEWDDSRVNNPFSKMDISRIQNITPNIRPFYGELMCGVFRTISPSKEVVIKHIGDEWYLVQIHTLSYHSTLEYYKCDQTEGIKELLKDQGLI